MAAYLRLYRFEQLSIDDYQHYHSWFPQLFARERLSNGVYRVLARLDTTDPQEAVRAIDFVVDYMPRIQRLVKCPGKISPRILRSVIVALNKYPELVSAHWMKIDQFRSEADVFDAVRDYEHTSDMMYDLGVANWEQALLRQTATVDQLARMHERYIMRHIDRSESSPDAPCPTFGIRDAEYFTVLKSILELRITAKSFRNCAAIFASAAAAYSLSSAARRSTCCVASSQATD